MALATEPRVGALIREWRTRRRMSQLDLALAAGVSARHLSFVETGRSAPSREMVLHLAEHLDVPLRTRNQLLLAAGYAPVYAQRGLDEPEMEPVRAAIDAVLSGDPALAALYDELSGYPGAGPAPAIDVEAGQIAVPLRLRHEDGVLSFISTLTTFATANDVTLAELAIESFFPADPHTAAFLRHLPLG